MNVVWFDEKSISILSIVQWMHNITCLERGSILLSWDWESHLGKNIRAYNCHNYSLSIHNFYDEHHLLIGYLYGVWSKNNYMYIQFNSHYIIMSLLLDQTLWAQSLSSMMAEEINDINSWHNLIFPCAPLRHCYWLYEPKLEE